MTKLTLNLSKLITTDGTKQIGLGLPQMHNQKGWMNILGQFATQMHPDYPEYDMHKKASPKDCVSVINGLCVQHQFGWFEWKTNTPLARKAMAIDRSSSSLERKIEKWKALFFRYGYEIEVIKSDKILTP